MIIIKDLYFKNLKLLVENKVEELDEEFLKDEKINFCNKNFYLEKNFKKVIFSPTYSYNEKLIKLFCELEFKTLEYIYFLSQEISIYFKVNEHQSINFYIFTDEKDNVIVRYFDDYSTKIGNVDISRYMNFETLKEAISLPNLLIENLKSKNNSN